MTNPKQPQTAEEILNDNWILSAICITGNHSHTGGDVQSEMEKAMHTHTAEHLMALADEINNKGVVQKLGQTTYSIVETYIKNNLK